MSVYKLDFTWFLVVMCGSVWLRAPSPSVPPAPECLCASLLLYEPDQRSPELPVSVGKEQELKHRTAGKLYVFIENVLLSNLVSEHQGDYFQHMHTPLLLALGRRQELDQVIETAHVNGPQQPIMDAGIIIHFLQEKHRLGKKYRWDEGQSLKYCNFSSASYMITLVFTLKSDLLFTWVGRYVKHISDQQQDPLYQQVILLLSLLPVLKEKEVSQNRHEETRR